MTYVASQHDLLRPVLAGAVRLSGWNLSAGKRLCDLLAATLLLVVASPVMGVVALGIKLSSRGPILYRQRRMGRGGVEFQLLKFRTMTHAPAQTGICLTRAGDPRITSLGRLLRQWKLDELPQFFNVLRGEMSLVGPRPDLSEYIRQLDSNQKQILNLRPGITGWATLCYRNEEQLLAQVPEDQLKRFYCTVVLPDKVRLDLDYAARASFLGDLAIVGRTARAVLV